MAGIIIYFISRMPREKKFGSEIQTDRSGNVMVSPEKALLRTRQFLRMIGIV